MRLAIFSLLCGALLVGVPGVEGRPAALAAGPAAAPEQNSSAPRNNDQPPPEELMRRRFPQPIRVGDLVGLPVLDWQDSTIGFVDRVVRTPEGKVQLIVPYSPRFGWARWLASPRWGKRFVAVPIEKIAILGRQLAALEMLREDFDKAPTWDPAQGQPVAGGETIGIAITRR